MESTPNEPRPAGRPKRLTKPVTGFVSGLRLPFEGLSLLGRERSLWSLAAVPVALCALALAIAGSLLYFNAGAVSDFVTGWLPVLEVGVWYQWLWLGPLKLLLWLVGAVMVLAVWAAALLAAVLLANVASAPFLDLLAQRVEQLIAGRVVESAESGWQAIVGEARRTMSNELQRLVFFVGISGLISLAGVLIPGGQLLAPPALVLFTATFLPLDYAGYHLDRRQVSFRRRRGWAGDHLPVMLGFGGAAMLTALVPGLNLLLLPALVTAGTLLALRLPIDDR